MQVKKISYRSCCQDEDMVHQSGDMFYCCYCGIVFEQEKYTDAAGDTDTRFKKREDLVTITTTLNQGMDKIQCQVFMAYIEWVLKCCIPADIVLQIEQEQKECNGEGYAALQEFICRNFDNNIMPAFLTGIGLIEAAEKIAVCAIECSLSKRELKNGIEFCKKMDKSALPSWISQEEL